MPEDCQDTSREGQIMRWLVDVRARAVQLLELSLPEDHRQQLHILHGAAHRLIGLLSTGNLVSSEGGVPLVLPDAASGGAGDGAVASWGATAPQQQPLHILLVEDNPFTQKLMTRLLTQRNHRVTLANHGQEALECIERACSATTPFDVVLMDVRMPVLDGLETTQAIRQWEERQVPRAAAGSAPDSASTGEHTGESRPRLPIIAVTTLSSEEDRRSAFSAGMDGFHGKPVQANQLFAEIERLVPSALVAEPPPVGSERSAVAEECAVPMELDMELLLKTVENDWSLLGEIVDLYRMDAPKQLQRIQDGIRRHDAELVREAAHSLKGATGAFGTTPTYELAYQVEQAGRNRNIVLAAELLEQLQESIASLETALDRQLCHNRIYQ
ncbi:MAG: response regulator [Magnetococcus sp. MYC-9]